MNLTKNQFYAVWIIFGLAAYYSLHQTLTCLGELLTNIGIHLNLSLSIVKYSKLILYVLATLSAIFVLIKISSSKKQTEIVFNPTKLRIAIVCLVMAGILSQIATLFIRRNQLQMLMTYLDNQNIRATEFYSEYSSLMAIPNILIFLSAIIFFFILTKDKAKKY